MNIDVRLLAPLATCLAIIVSVILWRLNQRRKSLDYQVLRREPILSLKGRARRRLDVRYDGMPVEDASLVVVRIRNSGHLPINPGDYQTRLAVSAPAGAAILSAEVTDCEPADLDERYRGEDGSVQLIERTDRDQLSLKPVLLNEGDSFTIQMLLRAPSGLAGRVKVTGHIQGVPRISEHRPRRLGEQALTQAGALVMAGSMVLVEPSKLLPFQIEDVMPCALMFLLGYVFLSAGMYIPRIAATMAEWES